MNLRIMVGSYLSVHVFLVTMYVYEIYRIAYRGKTYHNQEQFKEKMKEFEKNMQSHFIGLSASEYKINLAKQKDIYHVTGSYSMPEERQTCLSNLEHMIRENFLSRFVREENNLNILNPENHDEDYNVLREMANWFFPVNLSKQGSSFLAYVNSFSSFFETNEYNQNRKISELIISIETKDTQEKCNILDLVKGIDKSNSLGTSINFISELL